jgi:hypothetical protein
MTCAVAVVGALPSPSVIADGHVFGFGFARRQASVCGLSASAAGSASSITWPTTVLHLAGPP